MAQDEYRKAIFNAGVAYNTGAVTLPQAIDAATKDFLARGINCVEYRDGRRVSVDAYAEMALRTSLTRAYLQGESAKRDEWGVNTVIVSKRGIACPKCLKYVGKVFYDDVYGHVKPLDNRYPLLSSAIAGGLYHPNCRDIHTTYFEGISAPPQPPSAAEKKRAAEIYDLEQRQRYNERQIRKYKRLAKYTADPEQKQKYAARLKEWERLNEDFVIAHGDVLRRRRERERVRGGEVLGESKLLKNLGTTGTNSAKSKAETLTSSENGGIIEKEGQFRKDLLSGKINTSIDKSSQQKHINSSVWRNQVKQAIKDLQAGKKVTPRSRLFKTYDPKWLVDNYAGKGRLEYRFGSNSFDEFITLPFDVGVTFDKDTGKYVKTNVIQIKYMAEKGVHVFPTKGRNKQ